MLGQFSANRVLAETAEELEFKYMKVPLIMYVVNMALTCCTVMHIFLGDQFNMSFNTYHHLSVTTIYLLTTIWSLLFCFKYLIQAFKATDRLRETCNGTTYHLRFQVNIPRQFFAFLFLLLMLYYLSIFSENPKINLTFYQIINLTILFWLGPCSYYRQDVILSALYYICGYVVRETIVYWCHNSVRNCTSFRHLADFCKLVFTQTDILTSVNEILGIYLLVVLIVQYISICSGMLLYIHVSEPITANLIELVIWSIMVGVLVLSADSAKVQFEKFMNEVLDVATHEMTLKDAAKVRLLLYQTHNSWEFTAAGFTAVKTKLLLLFLSMGIDYLILLRQNEGYLKQLVGLTHSKTPTAPT